MSLAALDLEIFAARYAEIKARSRLATGPSPILRLGSVQALDAWLDSRSPVDWSRMPWLWRGVQARPNQLAPAGEWLTWLLLAGRGYGKTRAGSEWVRERVERGARRIALVGPTRGEIKRIMVQGDSGLVHVFPPWQKPEWKENDGEIHFHTGAVAYVITAEKTEARGGNYDTVWGDEPILWPHLQDLWLNILLALRRRTPGMRPQACITSTPRPLPWLRRLIMAATTTVTHGLSTENTALPESWHREMADMIGGTRLGAQELEAEILGDNPDALFQQSVINAHRVDESELPELVRIVVAIDPAVSTGRKSDATGIVVVGIDARGHVYVLADRTGRHTPEQQARIAFELADQHHADAFVVERNRAGDFPKTNLRAHARSLGLPEPQVEEVLAIGDKAQRALPVSTLYEKGRVHHVGALSVDGTATLAGLARLEAEMTSWDPSSGVSPNGLDALVHGVRQLTKIGEERDQTPDARAQWAGIIALAKRAPAPPSRLL